MSRHDDPVSALLGHRRLRSILVVAECSLHQMPSLGCANHSFKEQVQPRARVLCHLCRANVLLSSPHKSISQSITSSNVRMFLFMLEVVSWRQHPR
jgi:hypothetical protein